MVLPFYESILREEGEGDTTNAQVLEEFASEIISVIHTGFTFTAAVERGIVGDWQRIFAKILDHLAEIFTGDNDIPMILPSDFTFKLDKNIILKKAKKEFTVLQECLIAEKNFDDQYANANLKNSRKRKHRSLTNDRVLHIYADINKYNEEYLIPYLDRANAVTVTAEEERRDMIEEEEAALKSSSDVVSQSEDSS